MSINIQNIIKSAANCRAFFIDLVFPVECLGCDLHGEWLCGVCFDSIKIKAEQKCIMCGMPQVDNSICSHCRPDFYLSKLWLATNYDQALVRTLVRKFKYYFVKDLALDAADIIEKFLEGPVFRGQEILSKKDLILLPVPLHKKRLRWRGFNQSELIAVELGMRFGWRVEVDSLVRIKNTPPQAKRKEAERHHLANSFGISKEGAELKGKTVVLIDDVVTSGATIDECAKTLKQAGVARVWGLALARG